MQSRHSVMRSMGRLVLTIATLGILSLAGCAATGPKSFPAAEAPNDAASYVVGRGDTVQRSVWRGPELSASVPVRPDGRIAAPIVEDIVAAGRTPAELGREIEARLKKFV